MKIEIKDCIDKILFSYECENNTIKITLQKAIEQRIKLIFANLSFQDLTGLDFSKINLSGANLSDSNMNNTNLYGTNLSFANLSNASIDNSNLEYANLIYSNLYNASICDSYLEKANLTDAGLSNTKTNCKYISISCIGLSKSMITYCYDVDKIWFSGFEGTIADFERDLINKTLNWQKPCLIYKNQELFLKETAGAINYIKSLISVAHSHNKKSLFD